MTKTIWKYELKQGTTEIIMPTGAEILTVQNQGEHPMLWVLVEPDNKPQTRRFTIFGTGWPMDDYSGDYVATFQQGSFVWHVFEDVTWIIQ